MGCWWTLRLGRGRSRPLQRTMVHHCTIRKPPESCGATSRFAVACRYPRLDLISHETQPPALLRSPLYEPCREPIAQRIRSSPVCGWVGRSRRWCWTAQSMGKPSSLCKSDARSGLASRRRPRHRKSGQNTSVRDAIKAVATLLYFAALQPLPDHPSKQNQRISTKAINGTRRLAQILLATLQPGELFRT